MIDTIASIKENKFLLGTDSVTRNYARTDDEKTFLNKLFCCAILKMWKTKYTAAANKSIFKIGDRMTEAAPKVLIR